MRSPSQFVRRLDERRAYIASTLKQSVRRKCRVPCTRGGFDSWMPSKLRMAMLYAESGTKWLTSMCGELVTTSLRR